MSIIDINLTSYQHQMPTGGLYLPAHVRATLKAPPPCKAKKKGYQQTHAVWAAVSLIDIT